MGTSKIDKEIRDSMSDFSVTEDGQLAARFIFGEEFLGFQGHFPARKVLPGVCQIQCIKAMLKEWKHEDVVVREIVNAKYFRPVSPGEELTCRCKDIADDSGVYSLKASISRGGEKVSEFRLRVSFGEDIG